MSINDILAQRGDRYGSFAANAMVSQRLRAEMVTTANWGRLSHVQREALEMIAHKIARILNGNPDYQDSWVDIAGYATLVLDDLQSLEPVTIPAPQYDPANVGFMPSVCASCKHGQGDPDELPCAGCYYGAPAGALSKWEARP